MIVEYAKATENDFNDVVDFLDYVFSTAYAPTNFEKGLPAQYLARNFMSGANYIVKENGKVVANVGSYPVTLKVGDESMTVAAITAVGVHNRSRSKGYMKKLMDMAVGEQQKENVALSFLQGQRQRYEYFDYTPCGTMLIYHCEEANLRHYLGKDYKPKVKVSLKEVNEEYDSVYEMYNKNRAGIIRPRERFEDIMAMWENKTIGIYLNGSMVGYLSASKDYDKIAELHLDDMSLLSDTLAAYINEHKKSVDIEIYPHETEKIVQLNAFAAKADIRHSMEFNVMDYPAVLNAFLKLKAETVALPDGELCIEVKDKCRFKIVVSGGKPTVTATDEKPSLECTHLEAMQLFFSPASVYILDNVFARSIFPVPIFIRNLDKS